MSLFSKPPAWASRALLCLFVAAVALAWVFHRQWIQGEPFVGNFDRLNGGSLPLRLHEIRASQGEVPLSAWTDNVFMGINLGAHGAYHLGPSPVSWLMARFPGEDFLGVATTVAAALLGAAGLGAWATLRRLGFGAFASTAGAVCYACSTIITIRLSQSEGFAYNYVLGPWLFFLLLECHGQRPLAAMAGLGAVVYFLLEFSFLQETAYLWLVAAGFALVDSWVKRSPRSLALLLAASACAALAAGPRIIAVQRELALLQRTPTGAAGEVVTFDSSYAQQHLTSREGLRFFSDGIFGRFPAEAAALGNNINLNEGFQVYASTFASLLILLTLASIRPTRAGPSTHTARPPWLVAYAGVVVAAISLLVLTKPGLWLLYHLFLRLDFSHGRLVAAALFPLAILVAAGLDRLTPGPDTGNWRTRSGRLGLSLLAATTTFWGLHALTTRAYDPIRLELATPLVRQLQNITCLLAGVEPSLAAPTGGLARWIAPGVAALAWNPTPGATVEVELQDGESYRVMGRSEVNRYTIGGIEPGANYHFRLRARREHTASVYSHIFAVEPLRAGASFEEVAPALAAGEKNWLLSREVVYVTAATLIFLAWLFVVARVRNRPAARAWLVQYLAGLIIIEALTGLEFRLNGDHARTFPRPFYKDNLFTSLPGSLRPPSLEARQALHQRLERDHYRTVLLEPAAQFYSVTLHVPTSWDLRTPQGGWAGVPRRLAVLPWPDGVVSMRRLIFRPEMELPWPLLAALNVKYAVTVNDDLYFNLSSDSPHRFETLEVLENPSPVTPREFFAHRTIPMPPLADRANFPAPMPPSPSQESYVEGLGAARDWPAEGAIKASYAGDKISLAFTPGAQARFLVLNELYHPDWIALLPDGRRLPIYPVNTVMRGIEVPAGVSRLELEFHPVPGAALTLLAQLSGAILLAVSCVFLNRFTRLRPLAPASSPMEETA